MTCKGQTGSLKKSVSVRQETLDLEKKVGTKVQV